MSLLSARVVNRRANSTMYVPPRGEGFIGGLIGGLGGLITGGIPGAIGGAISGYKDDPPKPTPGAGFAPQERPPFFNPPFAGPPGVGIGPVRFGEGGGAPTMGPPKGYRLNKTSYFLKDGTFVPKGSKYVKIRRRNPLNPRALSRSMSRLESAKKAASAMGRIRIAAKKCR